VQNGSIIRPKIVKVKILYSLKKKMNKNTKKWKLVGRDSLVDSKI
jgi:hypothetical protein